MEKKNSFREQFHNRISDLLSIAARRDHAPEMPDDLEAHRQKMSRRRKKRIFRAASFVIVIVLVILLVTTSVSSIRWTGYRVAADSVVEKTDNVSEYLDIGDNILRYSSDGASLLGSDLEALWNVTYAMEQPSADHCGGTVVIYDKNGTSVMVFNKKGMIGAFESDRPLVKACVSKSGNVAALLAGGDNAVIKYYTAGGEEIAALSADAETSGYPADFIISEDGYYLTVSYMTVIGSRAGSRLVVYDFSRDGKSQNDNVAASAESEDTLIPLLFRGEGNKLTAVTENGFAVYKAGTLERTAAVRFDEDIVSVFHDESHVGFVFAGGNENSRYEVRLYSLNGKMIASIPLDFLYDDIAVTGDQVILFNRARMAVYSMEGTCRFDDSLEEGDLSAVIRTGWRTYLLVSSDRTETITLTF